MSTKVCIIDAARAKTSSQWRSSHWVVVSMLAAVCSTLAKETGVVTFALCLLMDGDAFQLLKLCRFLLFLLHDFISPIFIFFCDCFCIFS